VGHLKDVLPNKKQVRKPEHHPALPYTDLPSFMGDLCALDSLSAHALELTILTAARTQETLGARWDEIGLDERTWTVPADRMKAGKEHRVPLSDRAVAILLALPRDDSGYVFPGAKAGRSLSESSMLKLLRGLRSELTVHGFRSTFRDWAAERTAYPREVAEAALAHTIPDKVEAAYRRSDLFDKRRRLMAEWSKFCASTPVKKGELVAIGRVG
jgi:integrase